MQAIIEMISAVAAIFLSIGYFFLAGFLANEWGQGQRGRQAILVLFVIIYGLLAFMLARLLGVELGQLNDF